MDRFMVDTPIMKINFAERATRYDMHKIPVLLRVAEEETILTLLMRNLSEGGAYLLTKKGVTIGSNVTIQFALPYDRLELLSEDSFFVSVKAKVIRKNSNKEPRGIGISFNDTYKVIYRPRFSNEK